MGFYLGFGDPFWNPLREEKGPETEHIKGNRLRGTSLNPLTEGSNVVPFSSSLGFRV